MKVFFTYSNCIPIKGFLRGIIYDLIKCEFDFVPLELIEYLGLIDKKEESYVSRLNKNLIYKEYFEFIIKKDYGQFIDNRLLNQFTEFTPLKNSYSLIDTISVTIDNNSELLKKQLIHIIEELDNLGVKNYVFHFVENLDLKFLNEFTSRAKFYRVNSIDLVISDSNSAILLNNAPFIELITGIYINTNNASNYESLREKYHIFTKKNNTRRNQLVINQKIFNESHFFNVFYLKHLFINQKGDLNESINSSDSNGNILNDSIKSIIENSDYSLWESTKDKTIICHLCEFRYMCVDNTIPIKRTDNTWMLSTECDYNPLIAKWNDDEGHMDLKQIGIEIQLDKILLDNLKFKDALNSLYNIKFADETLFDVFSSDQIQNLSK